jgi:UDP-N-acetylmuramoyl-L-alanyl-D-glutamate--2,6-diaminopimelate ligase
MKKTLYDYLKYIEMFVMNSTYQGDIPVEYVTNDSRECKAHSLFIAIVGSEQDGHQFIEQAIERGATTVVHTEPLEVYNPDVTYVWVSDGYYVLALLEEFYADIPAKKLKLIGITGTNGKTTTAYLIYNLLKFSGHSCGLISTVEYRCGDEVLEANRTTPTPKQLQQLLNKSLVAGDEYVVMELSSHGLDQHRLGSVLCDVVLFTNLTGEHLDYHKTMDDYYIAKKTLFVDYLGAQGVGIINKNSPYGVQLENDLKLYKKLVTYGDCVADVEIKGLEMDAKKLCFQLQFSDSCYSISSSLIGEYNAENITGALLAVHACGVNIDDVKGQLEAIQVPGRLEAVYLKNGAVAYVDYAHTDDALDNVLSTLKPLAKGRLIVVFGCGGDRDKSKRSRMGKIAEQYGDLVIITSDNPRTEDPVRIIEDISKGVSRESGIYTIVNRKEAILKAIKLSLAGDIILVAGKGHEEYQDIAGERFPFSDKATLLKY